MGIIHHIWGSFLPHLLCDLFRFFPSGRQVDLSSSCLHKHQKVHVPSFFLFLFLVCLLRRECTAQMSHLLFVPCRSKCILGFISMACLVLFLFLFCGPPHEFVVS